ncbi:glycosyltransferase [Microbacterium sp. H1-D42]|uniref:glycosyltransferase n=1 Tax=Microbacterium sp. H1-D42 TaxID=2925844 RepID=UPI001F52FA92|nr:glycosyltransferase [Microbacterium sp. H1-D42]UNK70141.1 glycosyltransferase [Microbacterium sp. H1-D42]
MTALRILHVMVSDRFAGVEQFVRRLASTQAADGHQVYVAGGAPEMLARPLQDADVRFAPAANLREALKAIRSTEVDVVNSHMTSADLAAVLSRLAGRQRPALVSTRHFAMRRGSRGPAAAYRLIERMLDAEIAISKAVADSIHVPSTIVYPGVDPVDAEGAVRERTVLMAQRLQPEKDTALGIRAFAVSGIADEGWRLQIAGVGAEEAELRRLVDELGMNDSVTFLGFRDDLPQLMVRAGMLLATAPYEHFGLTVLEAMALRLPVVASGAAGHAEMLGDVADSALFVPGNNNAAAEQLRRLAGIGPIMRSRIAAAQLEQQKRSFTLRAQADGTEAVYRRAIAEKGTA